MLQRTLTLALTVSALGFSGLAAQLPPRPVEPKQDTSSKDQPDVRRQQGERLTDANILAILDRVNAHEVEINQMAQKQGSSQEVKEIAAAFVRDHTRMRADAQALAQEIGITPVMPSDMGRHMGRDSAGGMARGRMDPMDTTGRHHPPMHDSTRMGHQRGRDTAAAGAGRQGARQRGDHEAMHEAMMEDLRSKQGAEFDKAYLDQQIRMHERVIEQVKEVLLPSASNAKVHAFLEKAEPGLRSHLDMLRTAKKQLAAR